MGGTGSTTRHEDRRGGVQMQHSNVYLERFWRTLSGYGGAWGGSGAWGDSGSSREETGDAQLQPTEVQRLELQR